jgi:hypothetical protein
LDGVALAIQSNGSFYLLRCTFVGIDGRNVFAVYTASLLQVIHDVKFVDFAPLTSAFHGYTLAPKYQAWFSDIELRGIDPSGDMLTDHALVFVAGGDAYFEDIEIGNCAAYSALDFSVTDGTPRLLRLSITNCNWLRSVIRVGHTAIFFENCTFRNPRMSFLDQPTEVNYVDCVFDGSGNATAVGLNHCAAESLAIIRSRFIDLDRAATGGLSGATMKICQSRFENCWQGISLSLAVMIVVQTEFIGFTRSAIAPSKDLDGLDLIACYFEPSPDSTDPSVEVAFVTWMRGADNPNRISQCCFKSDKLELVLGGPTAYGGVFLQIDATVYLNSGDCVSWTGATSTDVVISPTIGEECTFELVNVAPGIDQCISYGLGPLRTPGATPAPPDGVITHPLERPTSTMTPAETPAQTQHATVTVVPFPTSTPKPTPARTATFAATPSPFPAFINCDGLTYQFIQGTLRISGSGIVSGSCTSKYVREVSEEICIDTDNCAIGYSYSFESEVERVIVDEGITEIGLRSFYRFNSLSSVSLPTTLITIDEMCFSLCSSLIKISFPPNLVNIGSLSFSETNITSVMIPSLVSSIGDGAFSSCRYLKTILVSFANEYYTSISGILFDYSQNHLVTYPAGRIDSIFITPTQTTSIGNHSLSGSKVETISLVNVVNMGDSAFSGSEIEYIWFNGSSPNIRVRAFSLLKSNVTLMVFTEFGSSLCTALHWLDSNSDIHQFPNLRLIPGNDGGGADGGGAAGGGADGQNSNNFACGVYPYLDDESSQLPSFPTDEISFPMLPTITPFPASTIRPNASPLTISFKTDIAIFNDEIDSSFPLVLNGSGHLQIVNEFGDLSVSHISNVTLAPDSSIISVGLFIDDILTLFDNSSLSTGRGLSVELKGGIRVVMKGDHISSLPLLSLGHFDSKSDIIPSTIVVEIDETPILIESGVHQLIIVGSSFTNCEAWRTKIVSLRSGLGTICEGPFSSNSGGGGSARLLSDDNFGLFVIEEVPTKIFTIAVSLHPGRLRIRSSWLCLFYIAAAPGR